MSGRVNVKFVVILTVVLLGVAGATIYGAATIILKSGEDHANNAMQAEAEGDWPQAQSHWGKAVNEERTNLAWLNSYMNAIQQKPTTSKLEYENQYGKYRAVLGSIATTMKTDQAAHERYLDEMMLLLSSGAPSRNNFQSLIDEVDRLENLLFSEIQADPDYALWGHIRRYRGEATAIIAQIATDLEIEFLDAGIEDLIAAQAVRPDDIKILRSLFTIYSAKAARAKLSGRQALVDESNGLALSAVQSFLAENPDDLDAQYLLVRADIVGGLRAVEKLELFGPDLTERRRVMLDGFVERATELAGLSLDTDLTGFDTQSLSQITYVLAMVTPEESQDWLSTIWKNASDQNPEDRKLQFAYSMFLSQLGRFEDAIGAVAEIAELPNVPVTTEGYLRFNERNRAYYQMTDAAIERWLQLSNQPESQPAWIEKAHQYRTKLSEEISDDHPMMLYVDARLALSEGKLATADKLFREFNSATSNSNAGGLRLAAEVSKKLGNPGLERDLLERARLIDPSDIRTLVRLASVHIDLRNYAQAEQILSSAHDRRPDLTAIKEQLDVVRALLNSDTSTDPVLKILAEAQLASDSGSTSIATKIIRDGIQVHPDDERMITALAQMLVDQKSWDEARTVIADGLAKSPDNQRLKALETVADIADDLEKIIGVVSEQDIPEIDKQLKLYNLHTQNEDEPAAAAALAAAEAIDANDKRVIVYRFDEAIRNRDAVAARRIYEANKDRDIDGADGLAIRARVELAEGDKESARRTLQNAVELGSVNAITLRLLADVLLDFGDTFNALERYREALDVRPNDLDLLKGYISILSRLGRNSEALDAARSAISIAERDEQFREMWLSLEGSVGDKQLAYERRLEFAENKPDDIRNISMLIGLSLDLRLFDEARERIDSARAQDDSLMLAAMDARWHADKGDLPTASAVFTDFISSDANDVNDPTAYLSFGRFLIDRGAVERGLTTIRQARLVQDPASPLADAVLSDELFRINRYEEAIPVLLSLVEADYQSELARSRLIECYTRMGSPELAQEMIDTFPAESQSELNMMLMRSDVARLQGNDLEAERLVDLAISEFPDDPLAYMKRAARLMVNRGTMSDAVEDLTRAIELDPANSNAYRLRSIVYTELGRNDDAARDIAASAEAAPNNIQLRLGAMQRLLQMDRIEAASDLVDRSLERRPSDISLMITAGDTFTSVGEHRTALRYYELAWEQSKTIPVGRRLAACLLEQPRPDIRRARLISQDQNMVDVENPALFIIRAKIEAASDNQDGVTTNLTKAYVLIKDDPNKLAPWIRNAITLLETEEAALGYIAAVDRELSLSPWASMFYAEAMLRVEDRKEEGIRRLSSMISDTSVNPAIVHTALKVRSMHRYGIGDFSGAADDMRRGIELAPADAELHNNLAYTLALHLNQADEAVVLAKRAVEINPDMRAGFDTLGLAYLESGKVQESIEALEQALSMAQIDADRAPVLVHLAKARYASGNTGGAQEAAQEARGIILNDIETFGDEIQDELEQILDKIRNQ
jgi:tetratricopeptide (TPR) repeat protein